MATAAENQLYPFSTQDGQTIPLDVIRPLSLVVAAVAAAGTVVAFPAAVSVCVIYGSVDMVLDLEAAASSPLGNHASALFVPAGTLITAVLPDVTSIKAIPVSPQDGFISVQSVQRWAGVGTQTQLVRR